MSTAKRTALDTSGMQDLAGEQLLRVLWEARFESLHDYWLAGAIDALRQVLSLRPLNQAARYSLGSAPGGYVLTVNAVSGHMLSWFIPAPEWMQQGS